MQLQNNFRGVFRDVSRSDRDEKLKDWMSSQLETLTIECESYQTIMSRRETQASNDPRSSSKVQNLVYSDCNSIIFYLNFRNSTAEK